MYGNPRDDIARSRCCVIKVNMSSWLHGFIRICLSFLQSACEIFWYTFLKLWNGPVERKTPFSKTVVFCRRFFLVYGKRYIVLYSVAIALAQLRLYVCKLKDTDCSKAWIFESWREGKLCKIVGFNIPFCTLVQLWDRWFLNHHCIVKTIGFYWGNVRKPSSACLTSTNN